MFEIEDNIPIPENGTNGRMAKYPFAKMGIGQSFFIPDRTLGQLWTVFDFYKKKFPDKKFIRRTVDGGVRIWRIE